jgi:hypothetical protein
MIPLVNVPMGRAVPNASLKEVALGSVSQRMAVGVPVITQSDVLRDKVPGSAGVIVQLVRAAPLFVNVSGLTDINVPTVPELPLEPE